MSAPLTAALALLPLVGFYVVESYWGIRAGIAVGIAIASLDLLYGRARTGEWGKLQLLMVALIGGLGGLSLASDDERFALWSPVLADLVFAGLLAAPLLAGRNPLEGLLRAQDPSIDLHPLQVRFLRGFGGRLCVNLLVHAALTAWAAGQARETWLFVSGVGQYGLLGAQLAVEVGWARLVVLPRVERDEEAERAATRDAGAATPRPKG